MFDWVLFALGTVTGLIVNYSRQTLRVADASEPVMAPAGKISIVIPTYNEEDYVERTLRCIPSQNLVLAYPDWVEILVVDSCSTDRTVEIASQFAQVISAARGKLNAKHAGVEASSGDIIVFMDADVIAKPNFLNLLLRHFQDPDVVGVAAVPISDGDIKQTILDVQLNNINGFLNFWLGGTASAIRRSAYYEVGGYDLNINQFDRWSLALEEEYNMAEKLRRIGRVIVDVEASVLASARTSYCDQCNSEDSIECRYCKQVQSGERF